jgi:cytoskeletal protein CcmA (bactofilin family)
LGTGTKLSGNLRFTGSVTVSGEYEGTIDADGFLYVRDTATVRADVKARRIIVGGTVHGNLEATEEVEMLPGCSVHGNVRAGRIRIADGVVFEGRCEMLRNSESLDVFSAPLEQLRRQAIPVIETGHRE